MLKMLPILKINKKGFTLIELMIVIAIIGILAAIAIPNFIAYRDKAFCSQAENDAQNTLAALTSYYADPDHTGVPDTVMLISVEDLSLNNTTGDVIVSGSITGIMYVQVFDSTMRCPYSSGGTIPFTDTIGGEEGDWTSTVP